LSEPRLALASCSLCRGQRARCRKSPSWPAGYRRRAPVNADHASTGSMRSRARLSRYALVPEGKARSGAYAGGHRSQAVAERARIPTEPHGSSQARPTCSPLSSPTTPDAACALAGAGATCSLLPVHHRSASPLDRSRAAMNHIEINWTACAAHGMCAELLPERITLDDWGYPIIDERPIPPELEALARRAVATCPTFALRATRRRLPRRSLRSSPARISPAPRDPQ